MTRQRIRFPRGWLLAWVDFGGAAGPKARELLPRAWPHCLAAPGLAAGRRRWRRRPLAGEAARGISPAGCEAPHFSEGRANANHSQKQPGEEERRSDRGSVSAAALATQGRSGSWSRRAPREGDAQQSQPSLVLGACRAEPGRAGGSGAAGLCPLQSRPVSTPFLQQAACGCEGGTRCSFQGAGKRG